MTESAVPDRPVDHAATIAPARRAFAEASDPTAYVARPATEAVLSGLDSWTSGSGIGTTVGALVGPPGLGKTFLLRLIEARHQPSSPQDADVRRALYLPYAGLPPLELTAWVYGLLGRVPALSSVETDVSGEDAPTLAGLLAVAEHPDNPFILLIDDADSMPTETLQAFVRELPLEQSPLRILMAVNDDARASRLLAGFADLYPRVARLRSAMSESETENYLEARLRWAGASPAELARLDADLVRRVHALAAGVPQAVNRIAGTIFDGGDAALPGDLSAKDRRENWMGQPIDGDPEIDPIV